MRPHHEDRARAHRKPSGVGAKPADRAIRMSLRPGEQAVELAQQQLLGRQPQRALHRGGAGDAKLTDTVRRIERGRRHQPDTDDRTQQELTFLSHGLRCARAAGVRTPGQHQDVLLPLTQPTTAT
jgi:hypothetical protein